MGLEKIPVVEGLDRVCKDPEHNPPMHIHIPPGYQFRHKCPACGLERVMTPNKVTFCASGGNDQTNWKPETKSPYELG